MRQIRLNAMALAVEWWVAAKNTRNRIPEQDRGLIDEVVCERFMQMERVLNYCLEKEHKNGYNLGHRIANFNKNEV